MVCKPKDNGGLGIMNFQKKNEALPMKHLDKFYNKVETPWVQLVWNSYYASSVPHGERPCGFFWWLDIMQFASKFRDVSSIKPGLGDSFAFWTDKWKFMDSSEPPSSRFPRLLSFVLDKELSAAEVFATPNMSQLLYLPLSA
jgi:hypothetical protein